MRGLDAVLHAISLPNLLNYIIVPIQPNSTTLGIFTAYNLDISISGNKISLNIIVINLVPTIEGVNKSIIKN